MPPSRGYFDSSALVKRYVMESGSQHVHRLVQEYDVLSSAIAPVEVLSALYRRRATGDLAEQNFNAILSRLQGDRGYWELVEVSSLVLDRAEELIQRIEIKTLDALHVASLMTIQAALGIRIPFITGDRLQRDVAWQLGLDVLWVG